MAFLCQQILLEDTEKAEDLRKQVLRKQILEQIMQCGSFLHLDCFNSETHWELLCQSLLERCIRVDSNVNYFFNRKNIL